MSDRPAVEATALHKSFGRVEVLRGVDLSIETGTVFALLGPNGAGKTTTVRVLATLTRPDSGVAKVAGFDVVKQRRRVRAAISLTGQSAAIDELQTGAENLRMMARLTGASGPAARRRAAELLERFELTEAAHRRVATYSGGMRRRLDLAAGLTGSARVIFLDEPTTGLDPRSRQVMWDAIGELVGTGVTVFLTTQYLEEADRLADRIAVLNAGRIVAAGTPAELKRRVGGTVLRLTMNDADAYETAATRLAGAVVRGDPAARRLDVDTDGTAARIRALLDDIDPGRRTVLAFSVHSASLDDVFLTLTERETADA